MIGLYFRMYFDSIRIGKGELLVNYYCSIISDYFLFIANRLGVGFSRLVRSDSLRE